MIEFKSEIIDKSQLPKRKESKSLKYLRMLEEVEDGKMLHLTFPIEQRKTAGNVITHIKLAIKRYNRTYVVHQHSESKDSTFELYIWRENVS